MCSIPTRIEAAASTNSPIVRVPLPARRGPEGGADLGASFPAGSSRIAFYDYAADSLLLIDLGDPHLVTGLKGVAGRHPIDGVVTREGDIYLLVDTRMSGVSTRPEARFEVYRWTPRSATWTLSGQYGFDWLGRVGALEVMDRAIHLTLDSASGRVVLQNKQRGVLLDDKLNGESAGQPATLEELHGLAWRTGWGSASAECLESAGPIPGLSAPKSEFMLMGRDASGRGYSTQPGPGWSGQVVARDCRGTIFDRFAVPVLGASLGVSGKGPLLVLESGRVLWLHVDAVGLSVYELRRVKT